MSTSVEIITQCRNAFVPIPALLLTIRRIQLDETVVAARLFDIERGLEFWRTSGLEDSICLAIEQNFQNIAQTLRRSLSDDIKKSAKFLKSCDKYVQRCQNKTCDKVLAAKIIESWRLFCFKIKDVANLLPNINLDVNNLLGEIATVPANDVDFSDVDSRAASSQHLSSWASIASHQERSRTDKISSGRVPSATNQETASCPPYVAQPSQSVPLLSQSVSRPAPSVAPTISPPPSYPASAIGKYADDQKPYEPMKPIHTNSAPELPSRPSRFHPEIPEHTSSQSGGYTSPQTGGVYINFHTAPQPAFYPLAPQQPFYQPFYQAQPFQNPPFYYPQSSMSYKSSKWSLRESLLNGLTDVVKPTITCGHGVRHTGDHRACTCCWHKGCRHN